MALFDHELRAKLETLAAKEDGRPEQAAITEHLRNAEVRRASRALATGVERNGTTRSTRRAPRGVVPPPPGWLPPLT